ncbi:hypothetical protein ACSSS7_000563 [Eimeria intestinalis]
MEVEERRLSFEKATQTGDVEAPVKQQIREEEVELREYTPTPPGPTLLTGNPLIDFVNRALDALLLDGPVEPAVEPHSGREVYVHPTAPVRSAAVVRECEGTTDYHAFFTDLCLCPIVEQEEVLAPLPTAPLADPFSHLDFFSREIFGQFSKDEPEMHLPYLHFHESTPHHRYTYVPVDGLPYSPGSLSTPSQK